MIGLILVVQTPKIDELIQSMALQESFYGSQFSNLPCMKRAGSIQKSPGLIFWIGMGCQ